MFSSLWIAKTGLDAQQTRMAVTSNNLANVNTPGFKPSRANFQDLLYIERMQPGVENAHGDNRPIGLYVGLGVEVTGTQTQFTQGSPIRTEAELDMTINGDGFFKVESPNSPTGYAYTRAGHFTKNRDGQVVLADSQGQKLIPEVSFPDGAMNITIDETGMITYSTGDDSEPQELVRIQLANFINPAGLAPIGGNLYEVTGASGPAIDGDPGTDNFGTIMQKYIEGSAVDPTKELIDLIKTQRAFEMNSNTIRTADETLRTVAQLKR